MKIYASIAIVVIVLLAGAIAGAENLVIINNSDWDLDYQRTHAF